MGEAAMRPASAPTRRVALPALLLAVLLACAMPARAEVRLGYVDSSRIWLEYSEAREAQQRFERQVKGWRDEAGGRQKTVDQLRKEVRDQGPLLSALKRQEKENALQRAISDYEASSRRCGARPVARPRRTPAP